MYTQTQTDTHTHTMLCTHAAHPSIKAMRAFAITRTRLSVASFPPRAADKSVFDLWHWRTCVHKSPSRPVNNAAGHFSEDLQAVRSTWHTEQKKSQPLELMQSSIWTAVPSMPQGGGRPRKISSLLGNPFRRCVYCLHGNTVNNLFDLI